jgi:hypothetical protein
MMILAEFDLLFPAMKNIMIFQNRILLSNLLNCIQAELNRSILIIITILNLIFFEFEGV